MVGIDFSTVKLGKITEYLLVALLVLFASWLFWSNFRINPTTNQLIVASKAASDFAGHIPLIRSFSLGDNYNFENPLLAGVHLRYHFLFYLVIGLLERGGVRLDWALNSLSIGGFVLFLLLIYYLAKQFFNNRLVGLIAVILVLFNGSLAFLEFFKAHHLSFQNFFGHF